MFTKNKFNTVKRDPDTIRIFDSHEEAERYDARERARMSVTERLQLFVQLQRRVWGEQYPEAPEGNSLREVGFTGGREMHD